MAETHVHRLQVAYDETDAQGHVCFANYLTYFDKALCGYLRAVGFPFLRLLEMGIDLVHASAHVSYHGWADHGDVLEIEVSIAKIGNTSLTAACAARKLDGTLVATGELTSICVDRETMKSTRVPAAIREALNGAAAAAPHL